jgi:tripartite-type tricarboxylate transporter receptor subunit TctC
MVLYRGLAALLLVMTMTAQPALAQSYPTQTVRVVTIAGPGSQPDILSRQLADGLSAKYGKPFVVDNKPGATGIIGAEIVKNAKPDGHTLLVADNAVTAINKHFHAKLSYDPERDFAPVTELVWQPFLVYASTKLGVKTMSEFVALLKSKPGQLNFGSAGLGSLHHLCTERLLQMVGGKATHIQYKTGGEISSAMAGGEIDFACSGTSGIQMAESGKANVLIVTSLEPTSLVPSVPTLKQATGLEGFELVARMGVLAPAGTPRNIVEQLSNDIRELYKDSRIRQALKTQYSEPVTEGPTAYAAVIHRELEDFAKVVKAAGIVPQDR